jgi:hypothetical protein
MQRVLIAGLMVVACMSGLAQTHQHGTTATGDGRFNPFIAADNRDGFYLAYVERTGDRSNVMLSYSADGKTFSEAVRVNDVEGDAVVRNENPPKVAVAPNGNVYVCWANERTRWKGNVRFARSTNRGKSFSPAISVNSDASAEPAGHAFQSIGVDKNGRIYIAWIDERNKKAEDRGAEMWMSTSEDGGLTFSSDRRILGDVCECCRSAIQFDAAGRLYLAYRTVPSEGPMLRDILVARSEDAGKRFAVAAVSRDGWEIDGCPVAGPSLSVDSAGRVIVVWFSAGGDRPGLYYAKSIDAGRAFTPRRLLDPQQNIGKHAHAVAIPGGAVLVAWDGSAGQSRIVWGSLDPEKGLSRRSEEHMGAAYPVLAANSRVAVIAAMRLDKHEVVTYAERLKEVTKQ